MATPAARAGCAWLTAAASSGWCGAWAARAAARSSSCAAEAARSARGEAASTWWVCAGKGAEVRVKGLGLGSEG